MNTSILCAIRQAVRAAPTVVLATGVFCPVAFGDPGDLVPDFGNVGRVAVSDLQGPAHFVAWQGDAPVFGGGEDVIIDYGSYYSSHYEHRMHGFAGRLSADGTLQTTFAAPGLADIQVIDGETQPDHKIVGIGHNHDGYIAFRLEPDGALDATFGEGGLRKLADIDGLGSVTVDPAGTIVIAGWLGSDLKIVRLQANGALDSRFGTAGIVTAAADNPDAGVLLPPIILSVQDGGYRITDNDSVSSITSRCRVLALTASGAVDESFGVHGYAGLAAPSGSISCNSMAEFPDGRLLVAGSEGTRPLLVRLLKGGTADTTFAVEDDLAATTMTAATALAVDPNTGSIVVAGLGPPNSVVGIPVARLRPDGSLDQQFGSAGTTWLDMPGGYGGPVLDMTVLPDGDVLVAGGQGYAAVPYVARLSGDDGSDSPGVLGVRDYQLECSEDAQRAVLKVRRMGGKSGRVSVAYATRSAGDDWKATEGEDFTATSGRLEWADGDSSDKQIVVPVAQDAWPEEAESFEIALSDAQGGAGLGTVVTNVTIKSDAPAAGMFYIEAIDSDVNEGALVARVYIARGHSAVGAVSVTLTPTSDTATASEDFNGDPLTVSWADGDAATKRVSIRIFNDSTIEPTERFSVQLTGATGGAVVRQGSTGSISIHDNDPEQSSSGTGGSGDSGGSGGGGGRTGLLSLLLLTLAGGVRARARPGELNAVRRALAQGR